jgi:predicted RNA binding protein YcfA (HicA-like mRNA interferase family)
MKIPRDIAASDLIRALRILGYEPVRQDGSHIGLTTTMHGTHHVTVPNHRPLKTGTLLGGILKPVTIYSPNPRQNPYAIGWARSPELSVSQRTTIPRNPHSPRKTERITRPTARPHELPAPAFHAAPGWTSLRMASPFSCSVRMNS